MLYSNKFSGQPALFSSETKSSLPNINIALKNTSDITDQSVFLAGSKVSVTLNFPNIISQSGSDLVVSGITGSEGDIVILGSPAPPTNTFYSGFVDSGGLVKVRFNNYSADNINPGSGTFNVIVISN